MLPNHIFDLALANEAKPSGIGVGDASIQAGHGEAQP